MFNVFGNATRVPPANWRDEPSTRGTWNILSSCLITLGLCLWTALHLNIPRHKEGTLSPKIRKASWLLLGLLAPEMIAYTAWYQRRLALGLSAVVRRRLGQRSKASRVRRLAAFFSSCCGKRRADSETKDVELDEAANRAAKRYHRWTTVHSFYAIMGGFVFDTSEIDVSFLPNSRQRLTLTPRGLLYILEHEPDLIPDISEEHIWDKSKAGNLAKTLVCLQALWFCVQCIVRCAQGLAVSLLELNVFGHAICALLMYCLWWNKPMDIEEPTALRGKMVKEMCALMCMRSFDGQGKRPELPYGVRYGNEPERNIAETSVSADEDTAEKKWYWLGMLVLEIVFDIYVKPWIDLYEDTMQLFSGKQREEPPGRRKLLQCRLKWTVPISVDVQVENADNDASHPVNLNYSGDALELEDETTTTSSSSTPAVAVDHGLHASRNATAQGVQSPPQDSSITTSDINGLSLVLGEWQKPKPGEVGKEWFVHWQPKPDYTPTSIKLSTTDVARWRLCASALQRYCPPPPWFHKSGTYSHQDFPAFRSVYERAPDWPSSEHLEYTGDDRVPMGGILVGFSFAGLVYGGLHLLAWDAPFPSQVEHTLWRSSGVLLASSGFIFIFSILVVVFFLSAQKWIVNRSFWQDLKIRLGTHYGRLARVATHIGELALGGPMLGLILAYIGARGYLVVESFLQLVHLPDSAYLLPGWSQYFPHIS